MSRKKILFSLSALLLICASASADFYFQQDVHTTRQGIDEENTGKIEQEFRRKIYVTGQVFVVQVEESGRLKNEYGFDFSKNVYYEADPDAGYYKLFDLNTLSEAFQRMGQPSRAMRHTRRGIAEDLSRGLVEGQIDYPGHVHQAFFAEKTFDGRPARLYKLRVGPGTAFLNFFGWYRKADIWAATDLPGYSEYEATVMKLRKKAVFYKIKNNQVSDLIVTLTMLRAVPLRIDSVAQRRFERSTANETSREITSFISNSPVKTGNILYFKEKPRFTWNTVFSKGTQFGPQVSLASGEEFDMRRSMPWLVIPVCFLAFIYLWFLGGFMEMDQLSLKRLVTLRMTIVFSLLMLMEVIHYLGDMTFLISPLFEFTLAAGVGMIWVLWEARAHRKSVEKRMRDSHMRFCPNCHARCEDFYVVCPKCNRPILSQ